MIELFDLTYISILYIYIYISHIYVYIYILYYSYSIEDISKSFSINDSFVANEKSHHISARSKKHNPKKEKKGPVHLNADLKVQELYQEFEHSKVQHMEAKLHLKIAPP